jgi:phage-related protein
VADDINLPNLVSHLQVQLGNTSGIVADAARQGSSVGAALGNSLQREVRNATDHIPEIQIDANSSQLDRDLHRVRGELDQLANQRIGVDISIEAALRKLAELEPHLDRLSHEHPDINVQATTRGALRQLAELRAAAAAVPDEVHIRADVDRDSLTRTSRLTGLLGGLGDMGHRTSSALLPLVGSVAKVSGVLGAVIPLAAGVVTTLVNMAPAAALAVTGLAAVELASGTVKLAMSGVGDTITAALDPSKAKDFEKSLDKLAPSARAFAREVKTLAPDLRRVQQDVQQHVFAGFDKEVQSTAKAALPSVRRALLQTADTLNAMGKGVASSARELATEGTLGKALKGATSGLSAFRRVPGLVVTAVGQIGAAAAPAFARLSKEGAGVLDKIAAKLDTAFKSGAMEHAIDQALSLLGTLGHVLGNVGSIFGSVFGAAQSEGGGMLGVLEDITGELAKIAKSDGVQAGLKAIFSVMSTLGRTVAPLLGQALTAIGPIFAALGPPVETLIENLGAGLSPVIDALAPVLLSASQAVGALIVAAAPLLPVIGELAASLLPALTPLLDAATQVFTALAPVVQDLASTLTDTLSPILAELPTLIGPLADLLAQGLVTGLQVVHDLLIELAPTFRDLGTQFADLLPQLLPLIEQLGELAATLFEQLAPFLPPLIALIGELAVLFTGGLAVAIRDVVLPALELLTALLNGDVKGAFAAVGKFVRGMVSDAVAVLFTLPSKAGAALAPLAGTLAGKAADAGARLVAATRGKLDEARSAIAGLPGRASAALGSLGSVLYNAGASLISGLLRGIEDKIPSVQGTLSKLTSMIPDWKGPRQKDASLLTPAGKSIIAGLVAGIDASTASLKSKLGSVTTLIERAITTNSGNRRKVSGLGSLLSTVERDNAQLLKLAKSRDAAAAKLKTATTKLNDLIKARSKAAADISGGILDSANITSGNSVTNSVSAITVGLQQVLAKTTAFAANIAALKKKGLRADLLQDIADAGVDGGAATADALAKATPAELKRINDLQAQLAKAASTTGATVAGALYDSGVKAAQGLVDGLKKQQGAIEKQMEKIATAMVKALKKALDMHSPSRKLRAVGSLAMAGLPQGFEDMRQTVARSAGSVASAAVAAASGAAARVTPYLPSPQALSVAAAGGATGGDTHNTFNLYGTETQPDAILRALSWRGLVGRR